MDGVKHFSDFFNNNGKKELPKFDKDEILNDFFINESDDDIQNEIEESSIEELNELDNSVSNIESDETTNESYSKDEVEVMIQKEVERIKKETIAEFKANESKEIELPIMKEEGRRGGRRKNIKKKK